MLPQRLDNYRTKKMRYHNQVELGVDVLLDDILHDRVFGAIEVDIRDFKHWER